MRKSTCFAVAGLFLATFKTSAHRIEYYTVPGCIVSGQSLVVDAYVVYAPASTHYRWQFKGTNGIWTCFVNGANTINGSSFTVSNASGTGANDAPALTIANPGSVLDNVQIRCLMRENNEPCGAPSGTTYGGDDLALSEVKVLRLRYNANTGACSIACTDNTLVDSDKYYGGFEAVAYSSSNGAFTDQNFTGGRGASAFSSSNSGAGSFRVMNNPYAAYSSFASFAPHSGNYQMIVKGNSTASANVWYKTVTVQPGAVYSFSVWAAKVDGSAPRIQLMAGNTQLAASLLASGNGGWTQVNGTYAVPPGVTSVTFAIRDKDAGSGAHNYVLDDICLVQTGAPIGIGDKVWFDVNRDGKQDASEPGVNNATVKLYYDGNGDNVADSANATYTAYTNSSGNYMFNGVIPGKYFVQFAVPAGYDGFTLQDAPGVPVGQNSTANVNTGKTGTHNFTADYLFKDAGLVKNFGISGNVYMDANGLTDNAVNGTPLSALGSTALYANLYKGTTFVASVAVSSGTYNFANLPGNTDYSIYISTIQANASGTPGSVLTGLWVSTGEFQGTGAGNDGTADGKLNVSLGSTAIANANFGMEEKPSAGTATAASQANPGDTTSITVPPATFVATDVAPGIVTAIRITAFPANATSITINGTKYTAATFPAAGVQVPAGANGLPTQAIAVDPADGAVTVSIPFKAKDNAGMESGNTGTASVPFFEVPDLTPILTVAPSTLYGNASFNTRIDIWNLSGVPTSGLVTVYLTKSALVSYTFNPGASSLAGSSIQNNIWTMDATSNASYYIFTTHASIEGYNKLSFGLNGLLAPGSTSGQLTNTTIIAPGSGNESNPLNNVDAEVIIYFQN